MIIIKNIIYLTDNAIYLYDYKNDKIIKNKINKNIIHLGKIADIDKFIKIMEQIIYDNKLNTGILKKDITIIVNPFYTSLDKIVLKNIFMQLNFAKLNIILEDKIINLNKDIAYINILPNILII